MNRWLSIGLVAAMLIPAAAFARDARGVRLVHFPQGELHSGDVVELTWSQAPRDIDELEILLSVDGGRHYALRVSPELDAKNGRWFWRVPQLSAAHASLRLRVGDERDEALGEPTPEFSIVSGAAPSNTAEPEARPVHETAWWAASEGAAAGAGAFGLRPAQASFNRGMESVAIASPRRDLGVRTAPEAPRTQRTEPFASNALPERMSAGFSRNLPLRE
jgi:hypothetical protein